MRSYVPTLSGASVDFLPLLPNVVNNPYEPPATKSPRSKSGWENSTKLISCLAVLFSLTIATSGLVRFFRYGGFVLLRSLSPAEKASFAAWTTTHLIAVCSMLVLAVGISKRKLSLSVVGILGFLLVCFYSWWRPMDFLWFG